MKQVKTKKIMQGMILFTLIFSLGMYSIRAQETLPDLEKMQDENMEYVKKIYKIIKDYPNFSYTYVYDDDGEVKKVSVAGVKDRIDMKRLEIILFDLKSNQNKMKNQSNRLGVYYTVDKTAEYKKGANELQRKIQNEITYPEKAKDWGMEGTIYVKFVVDENGEIPYIKASEDIESSSSKEYLIEKLKEEAISAVKETSGEWEPGEIHGTDVPSLAVLPVTFDYKKDPFLPSTLIL